MKCVTNHGEKLETLSPSMRREWIEITRITGVKIISDVSLHAEGVD